MKNKAGYVRKWLQSHSQPQRDREVTGQLGTELQTNYLKKLQADYHTEGMEEGEGIHLPCFFPISCFPLY
jgi:hypothetical protein